MAYVFSIFMILHGLAHLWYVTLSLKWVAFKPEMGWSGDSWLLTSFAGEGAVRILAAIFYSLASLGFIVAGAGLIMGKEWFRPLMMGSAVLSVITIVVFWDGIASQIVEKGLFGFIISGLVLIGLGFF